MSRNNGRPSLCSFRSPVCLACHGTPKEEVQSTLNQYYPNDQATGYALGDLRGALWIDLGKKQ